ncbi:TPA: hypothetical protein KKN05_004493 [Shigella flexneri]|nr:hypothetical protein [Shigella flexneri]
MAKTTGYDIALPVEISAEDLEKARKDAQMFAELILQHPEEVGEIVNKCLTGNARDVRDLAMQIGFTEDQFAVRGGGFPWVVVIIAVAAAVLLEHD